MEEKMDELAEDREEKRRLKEENERLKASVEEASFSQMPFVNLWIVDEAQFNDENILALKFLELWMRKKSEKDICLHMHSMTKAYH